MDSALLSLLGAFVLSLIGLFAFIGSLRRAGAIYCFLPKIIGRPIRSYNLSLLGFWTLAFSVQGSLEALRSINTITHFTHFTVAHALVKYLQGLDHTDAVLPAAAKP